MKRLLAAFLAVLFASSPAAAQADKSPKPANIDRNGTLMLIRSTLLAVDHANKTGNYTVLRDLGSPAFQGNSAARLGEIFTSLRKDNVDLSGVAALDPQLTLLPQIEANGMLHMTGFFPSIPTQVNFELLFEPSNGQWRLFGVSVNLGSAMPAPPAQGAPASNPPRNNVQQSTGQRKPGAPVPKSPAAPGQKSGAAGSGSKPEE